MDRQRLQQGRSLLRLGLLMIPVALIFIGIFWFIGTHNAQASQGIRLLGSVLLGGALLIALLVYLARRQQDRLYDQHFICGPQKLVHIKNGKPVSATPYSDIWLGDASLILKGKRHALYIGLGKLRQPFWTAHDIQREIGSRIPSAQFFASDGDMGRALLRSQPVLGLRLMLAKFTVAGLVVLLLALKFFSLMDHLHIFTLWKIFHPK